jgi:hypothetical protein
VLEEYRNRLCDLTGLADRLEDLLAKKGPALPPFGVARVALWADQACAEGTRLLAALEAAEDEARRDE